METVLVLCKVHACQCMGHLLLFDDFEDRLSGVDKMNSSWAPFTCVCGFYFLSH